MKIGIIGRGVVGNALYYGLYRRQEIISYDKYKKGFQNLKKISECKIIFICVPTPPLNNGKINLEFLYDAIISLTKIINNTDTIIVIKSTVIPGTTDILAHLYPMVKHWAFCPEFLNNKTANEDFINADRIIIGTDSEYARIALYQIFRLGGFDCPIHFTSTSIAEFVKYYSNILGATKVTLANEMYNIAQGLELDYNEIKRLVVTNHYFKDFHLDVPGHDGKTGFGGKCFNKDLSAFIYFVKELRYNPSFLKEIQRSNKKFRRE